MVLRGAGGAPRFFCMGHMHAVPLDCWGVTKTAARRCVARSPVVSHRAGDEGVNCSIVDVLSIT